MSHKKNTYLSYTNTHTGSITVGRKVHSRVPTKTLQSGPGARRGRSVPLRSRCVCCYAHACVPVGGGRKMRMQDGSIIPNVTFACNICRVVLCKSCFDHVYDHRTGGKPQDCVTLM